MSFESPGSNTGGGLRGWWRRKVETAERRATLGLAYAHNKKKRDILHVIDQSYPTFDSDTDGGDYNVLALELIVQQAMGRWALSRAMGVVVEGDLLQRQMFGRQERISLIDAADREWHLYSQKPFQGIDTDREAA